MLSTIMGLSNIGITFDEASAALKALVNEYMTVGQSVALLPQALQNDQKLRLSRLKGTLNQLNKYSEEYLKRPGVEETFNNMIQSAYNEIAVIKQAIASYRSAPIKVTEAATPVLIMPLDPQGIPTTLSPTSPEMVRSIQAQINMTPTGPLPLPEGWKSAVLPSGQFTIPTINFADNKKTGKSWFEKNKTLVLVLGGVAILGSLAFYSKGK